MRQPGVAKRQRRQQQGVDRAEQRGVGADADRQCCHGDRGEARRPHEGAEREAPVLREDVKKG
jgi:hypothetical protein